MTMVKEIFSYFLVFVVGFLVSGLVQYAVKSYFKKIERHYYYNEVKREETKT